MLEKNKTIILLSIVSLIYFISCFTYFFAGKNDKLENQSKTSLKSTTGETYDVKSELTQLGTTVDAKKEYLVFDDILFTMEKNLRKGAQVELKLIKNDGRNQYEVYVKKNVIK
ncbi:hypothetical protein Dtox_2865 [Desulfofarcimen acetoxidans DSM 771]|uniref:Uncharacterized protein n=1 Tax=Desulfofarcimen acetoxidans (strain ATCC 49208 / DSM 771 / KCTC 5769 / VKM B-1644 / 5575) TaxID=485916 RepID=C8W2E6_DESAS|nr:hypothetical protein [Desulfofarcimen acetoxidans]ACV63630.1 hypothetical protein Dtox_2865 [Desulfofarcimen acetoxidans DSM 771]